MHYSNVQVGFHNGVGVPFLSLQILPLISNRRFDFIYPVFQKMPESFAKRHYRCPTALEGPFQDAYDTKLTAYDSIMEPRWADTLTHCNLYMKGRREGTVSWLEFYPFVENILAGASEEADSALIVDVGGGLGHGLVEIKQKFSHLKGRLILQDLPNTIQQAENGAGIFEPMAHDFFTPQPIKGSHSSSKSSSID